MEVDRDWQCSVEECIYKVFVLEHMVVLEMKQKDDRIVECHRANGELMSRWSSFGRGWLVGLAGEELVSQESFETALHIRCRNGDFVRTEYLEISPILTIQSV